MMVVLCCVKVTQTIMIWGSEGFDMNTEYKMLMERQIAKDCKPACVFVRVCMHIGVRVFMSLHARIFTSYVVLKKNSILLFLVDSLAINPRSRPSRLTLVGKCPLMT